MSQVKLLRNNQYSSTVAIVEARNTQWDQLNDLFDHYQDDNFVIRAILHTMRGRNAFDENVDFILG